MIKGQEGIKKRIELNGGRALLDFENGDVGIEDSNSGTMIVFHGTELDNFTEQFVGLMTVRAAQEMTKHGII